MEWLLLSSLALPVSGLAVFELKKRGQAATDRNRKSYVLTFPSDLDELSVQSWLRAIVGSLNSTGFFTGIESIVFETWANDRGITHVISVPSARANYVISQLRTHVRGIRVEPQDERSSFTWTHITQLGSSAPHHSLAIPNTAAQAASMLASVQALDRDETVLIQWVLSSGKPVAPPRSGEKSDRTQHQITDMRSKIEDTNLLGVGRIATVAKTDIRAKHLASRLLSSLTATRTPYTRFYQESVSRKLGPRDIYLGATPLANTVQFSVKELSAVIAWPIGSPLIAGLPQGSTRHLPATESIAREGRVLGRSNFPGSERPIALGRLESLKHLHILGPTGVGKTTLLANLIEQDLRQGYGAIVMESKGDLFQAALDYIPADRIKDVIVLDVNEHSKPIGFNILEQGNPRIVVDQLTDLFQSLYQDTRGVWMRELLFHGLCTLVERKGMTFVDLAALISPRTLDEQAWAAELKKNVSDRELRQFWDRWEAMPTAEKERNAGPLHNRIWQLISRPELRNIIGQSESSFQMADVIRENKVLLINLAGVPREAASLAGTLIMNALWQAVQSTPSEKPTYLYLDEFQDFMRLPIGAEEMLAKARGFSLGMTLAHQHLDQLDIELRSAVMNNARSKVVFQAGNDDARIMQRAFGTNSVSESDFTQLGQFEAIAKLVTATGSSSPVTLMTNAPAPATGTRSQVIAQSKASYGRDVNAVESEIITRRTGDLKANGKRPNIGIREWGN